MLPSLTFATRSSALARWQTEHIIRLLQSRFPGLACKVELILTSGDRILDKPLPEIVGKGIFTYELEEALRAGRVNAAVHSLKDLPTEESVGLVIAVIPERGDGRDVWICPTGHNLKSVSPRARVGTSSIRRRAQLLALRPDLHIEPIRGNVDTRLRKVQEGQYDAIVLAAAGLIRLGLQAHITEYLSLEEMLPAPGQAALAVQCRAEDETTRNLLTAIDHLPTRLAVTAERAFLNGLGGGCSLPIGAYATMDGEQITLQGKVATPNGERSILVHGVGTDPVQVGTSLATRALAQGAAEILGAIS